MPTAAIVFSDGCEEVEGLSQVDVLRRLGIACDMVALEDLTITGGHGIRFACDKLVDDSLLDYDLVAFPGGAPNAKHLRESGKLAALMKDRFKAGKWNAAMCASPIALSKYGFLTEAKWTSHPDFKDQVASENPASTYVDTPVAIDQDRKLVTSRGPATSWAFAYALAQVLGVDTAKLEDAMQYSYLRKHINEAQHD
ncbi:4-methyl-5(B-hydroxyethyl)-thiazole monophosphate biosynthesis protein [Lactobacillus nasalidis]|uniref:4-methyl-5(B-hydroxyethyl)-thiazole monophosphate biosynthesis protein n=1 Tax=Lactobacillus nasalidis TaxID=2797258 RepID=A0ABQ3W7B5_9LACO|nr:DJ-1 family glyoxalase III [Lactobacillus nasalidis]GHV98438.1 4-methyl-5(B-hydroxyethyl)-thiazole monophosphate biosynthesis protein [Lactobacillus nasalidis]GHV99508.1 4-methyl-5(B-hydroxyethyl)-thiazole monophosphate biosynthesis protein [Lactobacillus nasalidis]GHW00797.1 4-methyl-5(B-hydroxyethyl)-thiazole monophosphate biosynthesis protein [Lactobacillus nasalidis]